MIKKVDIYQIYGLVDAENIPNQHAIFAKENHLTNQTMAITNYAIKKSNDVYNFLPSAMLMAAIIDVIFADKKENYRSKTTDIYNIISNISSVELKLTDLHSQMLKSDWILIYEFFRLILEADEKGEVSKKYALLYAANVSIDTFNDIKKRTEELDIIFDNDSKNRMVGPLILSRMAIAGLIHSLVSRSHSGRGIYAYVYAYEENFRYHSLFPAKDNNVRFKTLTDVVNIELHGQEDNDISIIHTYKLESSEIIMTALTAVNFEDLLDIAESNSNLITEDLNRVINYENECVQAFSTFKLNGTNISRQSKVSIVNSTEEEEKDINKYKVDKQKATEDLRPLINYIQTYNLGEASINNTYVSVTLKSGNALESSISSSAVKEVEYLIEKERTTQASALAAQFKELLIKGDKLGFSIFKSLDAKNGVVYCNNNYTGEATHITFEVINKFTLDLNYFITNKSLERIASYNDKLSKLGLPKIKVERHRIKVPYTAESLDLVDDHDRIDLISDYIFNIEKGVKSESS